MPISWNKVRCIITSWKTWFFIENKSEQEELANCFAFYNIFLHKFSLTPSETRFDTFLHLEIWRSQLQKELLMVILSYGH